MLRRSVRQLFDSEFRSRTPRRSLPFRPSVEALEGRCVPALILGLDGSGRLHSVVAPDSSQTAGVTLTVQPGNTLTVAEGGTVYGTFPVSRSLDVSLGDNAAGFVNRLDLNNSTLHANVRVELGDMPGVNQFRLTTGPAGNGTLDGNYSVQGGDTGSEFVVFGDFGQTAARTINVTGSVRIDMGGGGQDPNFGPPDAVSTVGTGPPNTVLNVGGNFTATGSTLLALRGTVGGNLSSDSSGKPVGQEVILGNYSHPFEVGGNVAIKTGDANDEIDLQAVMIKGNTNINTGGGDDLLLITTDVDLTSTIPTRLGGNLFVDTGEGNDEVQILGLRAPEAHAQIFLGGGDDTFRIGSGAVVKLSSLTIDGGPGSDTYDPGVGNVFDFAIRLRGIP